MHIIPVCSQCNTEETEMSVLGFQDACGDKFFEVIVLHPAFPQVVIDSWPQKYYTVSI